MQFKSFEIKYIKNEKNINGFDVIYYVNGIEYSQEEYEQRFGNPSLKDAIYGGNILSNKTILNGFNLKSLIHDYIVKNKIIDLYKDLAFIHESDTDKHFANIISEELAIYIMKDKNKISSANYLESISE